MDLLHDTYNLPGALGRRESAIADPTSSTFGPTPTNFLSPLRRLIRTSRYPGDIATLQPNPETPLNTTNEPPENPGYRIQVLRAKLDQAQNYSEWLAAASELDALEDSDAWKLQDESHDYDVHLVKDRLRELDDVRISRDQKKIMMLVRTGLTRNLGGMGSLRLYKHSRVGTKALIERYIESVLDTVDALVEITRTNTGPLEPAVVLQELLLARQAFGRSALLLSGGGTFGMNHIGVIKCLFDANLLPRIISGASAGSIVCSVLCTKTDDEIPKVLKEFCYGDLQVFEKAGQETSLVGKAYRLLTKGSLFDISHLVAVMKDLLGDLTFQEAYNKTRRILNICVSTASLYELPRLLNYVTAPNVLIWSAVAASCSVPLVFSPGQLLAKDPRTGEQVPWNQSSQQWIDGSVENDIPIQRLSEMFNVNHFIVSQVNPHVVPFLEKDEKDLARDAKREETSHNTTSTWAQTFSKVARDEAMHRLQVLQEFGVVPNVLSKIRSIVGQRYAGDITIFPKISYAEFPYVLSNPDEAFMVAASLSGERATWPKLSEIRNHCAIELAIDDAVHQLMTCVAFGPCQLDQHSLMTLGYPVTMSAQRHCHGERQTQYRRLRTSLDLPRLGLRQDPQAPKDTHFLIGPAKGSLRGKKGNQKTVDDDEDLHSFSDSDATDSDDDTNDHWPLSADDDDSSSESEARSPPSFAPRPSAVLFPWASQPATPSAHTRPFAITPLLKTSDTPFSSRVPAPAEARPSSPELRYKKLFHGNQPEATPVRKSKSVVDFDISGTRGMMRRRKTSTSFSVKKALGLSKKE